MNNIIHNGYVQSNSKTGQTEFQIWRKIKIFQKLITRQNLSFFIISKKLRRFVDIGDIDVGDGFL